MDDPAEKPDHYEYYLLGHVTPVRVAFDKAGRKMGAEVPDAASASGLRLAATYLTRLDVGDFVEEIDDGAFKRSAASTANSRNNEILHCRPLFAKGIVTRMGRDSAR